MSTQTALLKTMNEFPRESTPRLVYADWCEENGRDRQAAYYRGDVRLGGLVGRGGLGGLVGRGGLVGYVESEHSYGWVLNPAREVIDTKQGDNWVELAGGKNKRARANCTFGTPIEGGFRVPLGSASIPWAGGIAVKYQIELLPQIRPDETEWLVTGGREPYTVRRNGRGEFRCTCPDMTRSHSGRRDMVRRNGGCKHCRAVIDSLNVEEMIQEVA